MSVIIDDDGNNNNNNYNNNNYNYNNNNNNMSHLESFLFMLIPSALQYKAMAK